MKIRASTIFLDLFRMAELLKYMIDENAWNFKQKGVE